MVVIPPGSFMMGSPSNERGRDRDESPQHRVDIRYKFAVGRFEVTQSEWRAVMGNNPSYFKGERNPVEKVSWHDARSFIQKLGQMTGKRYRLLSEAEWEYVARAGTTTPFHTGNQINASQANFNGNFTYGGSIKGRSWQKPIAVGEYSPNRFGVYDMHGNVREWVGDCWNKNYNGAPSDGSVWTQGDDCRRVVRGGYWESIPRGLRSAGRDKNKSTSRYVVDGFRVAQTLSR